MPIKKKITLKDLADELGLTVHTVSKALRGLPGMSEHTRSEVRKLADKLGYHTKEQERSLLFENTPIYSGAGRRFVFIVAADQGLRSGLHRVLLESVQQRLAEAGHTVEVVFVTEDLRLPERFQAWIARHNLEYADGLFISPVIPEAVETRLIALPMPRILLHFPPPGASVDSVIWNVYDAMQQAARYLIDNGHRRMMYIGDIKRSRGYRLRWQAFNTAVDEAGIQLPPEDSHILKLEGPQDEWTAMWLDKVKRYGITAFVCASEEALTRTYMACQVTGISLPKDCSLVGLEPEAVLPGILPDITRPTLPVTETGHRAVDRMLWRIANPSLPYEHILLQGGLHKGTTVRTIPAERIHGL